MDFLFVEFELVEELLFGGVLWKAFDEDGEVGGGGAFVVDFHLFNLFIVLKDGEGDEPDDNHTDTNPALNVVIGVIFGSCI